MNSVIVNLLNKILGSWVENLNTEQLNLSLFSGVVVLENLQLRQNIFQVLGLPFEISSSLIGKIQVKIPWSAWYSSPLSIEIKDVCIYLRPIHLDNWNESTEKSLLLQSKKYHLEQFEIMHPEYSEVNKDQGFFSSLLKKLINNVHIHIKDVYIRFEDTISHDEPFAAGLILSEMTVETCNEFWETEFQGSSNEVFKLIQIEHLCFFEDYDDGIVLMHQWYDGNQTEVLKTLIDEEKNQQISHRYILFPFSARGELVIDNCPKSPLKPKISFKCFTENLQLQISIKQIHLLVKLHKYTTWYQIFSEGIKNEIFRSKFTEKSGENYRKAYKKLRKKVKAGKSTPEKLEKLKEKVEKLEFGISVDEIVLMRGKVLESLNLKILKKVKEKEKEKAIYTRENKRRFSTKVIDFIALKSTKRLQEEEALRNQRLTQIETDLSRVYNRSNSIIKHIANSIKEQLDAPEQIKYSIHFRVQKMSFELIDETFHYLSTLVQSISVHLILRSTSQKVKVSIGNSNILNKYPNSPMFPKFFESEFLYFGYDTFSHRHVKMESGEFFIFLDFESINFIASIVKQTLTEDIEFAKYLDEVSETTARYMAHSQDILNKALNEGTEATYELEIDLKAPMIVFPIDARKDDSPVLFIDFGRLNGRTSSKFIGDLEYDVYRFELSNLRIFTEKNDPIFSEILTPMSVDIDVFICKKKQLEEPGYYYKVNIGKTQIFFSDLMVMCFAEIGKKTQEFSAIFENTDENTTTRVRMIDNAPGSSELVVPKSYHLEIEECNVVLIEKSEAFASFSCRHIVFRSKMSKVQSVIARFVIGKFLLQDLRPGSKWKNILSTPLLPGSNEIFEDAKQEISQLRVTFKSNPQKNIKDISVKMFDTRLTAEIPFYYKIHDFYQFCLTSLTRSEKIPDHLPGPEISTTSRILNLNSRFCINFEDFEMFLPISSSSSWEMAVVRLNMILVYVTQTKVDYRISPDLNIGSICYLESKNDANTMLNHVNLELRTGDFTKVIISPSRITIDYTYHSVFGGSPETSIQARMESLCMVIGFHDYDFLQKLNATWYSFMYPDTSKVSVQSDSTFKKIIDFDALQITIQDDTIKHPYSIAFLQFSNFYMSSEKADFSTTRTYLSTVFFMNYYNIPLGVWEPMIEDWKFEVLTEYKGPDEPYKIDVNSDMVMNLNITKSMTETSGTLMKRFYQTSDDWGPMQFIPIPSVKNLDYEIVNKLGVPVKIWFVDPQDFSKNLENNEKFLAKFADVKKFYSRVKPKNKFEAGVVPVFCINLQPVGYHVVGGLRMDDSNIQTFTVKSLDNLEICCRKQILVKNSKRVIIFSRDFSVDNSTGVDIEIYHEGVQVSVTEKFFLPVNWNIEMLYILTRKGLAKVPAEGVLEISPQAFAVVGVTTMDSVENKCKYVVEVQAPYVFVNLLPCPINILNNGKKICCIFSGDKHNLIFPCVDSTSHFTLELLMTYSILTTEQIILSNSSPKVKIIGKPKWTISSLIKKANTQSNKVTFSSQYLAVNSTDFTFCFGKILISPHEIAFFSTGKTSLKLKSTENFKSDWSEKINLKAVGVSSCVVLKVSNLPIKNISIGTQITQATRPLALTKVIKIQPRFVIANRLDFKIYLKQNLKKKGKRIVEIDSDQWVNYQLDDYFEGCNVVISEDKCQWSGPFSLNDIEDFQVRFKASPREVPKKQNIFAKDPFWYLSCPKNQMFYYVQVHVAIETDACINIVFSNPYSPSFQINNSTSEPIEVVQLNYAGPKIVILPGTAVPWAFDNHLQTNKKIEVKLQEFKQKFSLEKIVEKSKNVGPHLSSIKFEGESRVLTIYDIEETQIKVKIRLIQEVTQKYSRNLTLSLIGVNLSLIDEQNSENFLVSLGEIKLENFRSDEKRSKQVKTRNKFIIVVGNFQVDNMLPNFSLFPVVIYQLEPFKDEPFFQIRYDREYTTGDINSAYVNQIDRVLEFDIQMQQIYVKLNYEFLQPFTRLSQIYMQGYYQLKPMENSKNLLSIEELYPELLLILPPPSAPAKSVNTYFKYIHIHGLKVVLTFANTISASHLETSEDSSSNISTFFLDIASIDNTPLQFTEVIVQHSFQNQSPFTDALAKNYIRQGLLQFYKILGSSELLGDPIGLIDKLGTGVYEFFNEPVRGLLQGPKGFVNGVGKGVRSLVANVIGGSFDSVSKITGSLYKIVSYDNVGPGNIYRDLGIMDLANGVTGIVNKPYLGYKKSGAKGLISGVGIGMYSALVCPVTAVLHFSTTVTSQVAKTADMVNFHIHTTGRIRYPRHISSSRALQSYNNNKAKNRYFIMKKGIQEKDVQDFIELGKECVAVMEKTIVIIVAGEVIEEIDLSCFDNKEIHFHQKRFLLTLTGEKKSLSLNSNDFAPIMKLFLAIGINEKNN